MTEIQNENPAQGAAPIVPPEPEPDTKISTPPPLGQDERDKKLNERDIKAHEEATAAGHNPQQVGGTVEPNDSGEDTRTVYLPGLVADEFGTSASVARQEIMLGVVEIDGEALEGEAKLDVPYAKAAGKSIVVRGEHRTFTIDYRG